MTATELRKHMSEECSKTEVECLVCEVKFVKESLVGHDCAAELRKKVDAARNEVKEIEE